MGDKQSTKGVATVVVREGSHIEVSVDGVTWLVLGRHVNMREIGYPWYRVVKDQEEKE